MTTLPPQSIGRVVTASSLGTVFEWYDFYIYGILAAVFGKLFFPPGDETLAFLGLPAASRVDLWKCLRFIVTPRSRRARPALLLRPEWPPAWLLRLPRRRPAGHCSR